MTVRETGYLSSELAEPLVDQPDIIGVAVREKNRDTSPGDSAYISHLISKP